MSPIYGAILFNKKNIPVLKSNTLDAQVNHSQVGHHE